MRLATLFIQLTHSRTRLKAFPHVSVCSAISVKDLDLWLATLRPYCRSSRGGDTFSSAGGSATRPTVDLLEDIGLIKQSLRKNTRRDATRHHNTSPRWYVASGRVLSTRATQSCLAEATSHSKRRVSDPSCNWQVNKYEVTVIIAPPQQTEKVRRNRIGRKKACRSGRL
jgi:hypothetical protein